MSENLEKVEPYIKKCKVKEWREVYNNLEDTLEDIQYLSEQELDPEQEEKLLELVKRRADIGGKITKTIYEEGLQKKIYKKDKFLFWGPIIGMLGGLFCPPLESAGLGVMSGDALETGIKRKSGWRKIQGTVLACLAGFTAYCFFTGHWNNFFEIAMGILGLSTLPLAFMNFLVGKKEKIKTPRKLPEAKYMEKELRVFARRYNELMEKYKGKLEWVGGEDYEKEMFDLIDNWGISEYFEDGKKRTFLKGGGPKKAMKVIGKSKFAQGRANPITGKIHMFKDAMTKPKCAHVYLHEDNHLDGGNEARCELETIRILAYLNEIFPNQGYDLQALLTEIRITGHAWAHQRKKELKKETKNKLKEETEKEIKKELKKGLKEIIMKFKIYDELKDMGFPETSEDEEFKLLEKDQRSPIEEILRFAFPSLGIKAFTLLQAIVERDDYRGGYTIGAYRKIQMYKAMLVFGKGKYEPKEVKMMKKYKPKARAQMRGLA